MSFPSESEVGALFLAFSGRKLEEMTTTMTTCLGRLTDEQVWQRGGEHENAVGNLVLHLCGNMRQWILFGVDKQPDVRVRDEEFSTAGGMTAAQLAEKFAATTREAAAVITALPVERLLERTNPQRGEVSVLEAIYQVVGHVQQHTGQVVC